MRIPTLIQHLRRRLRKRSSWAITLGFTFLFALFKFFSYAQFEGDHPLLWVSALLIPFLMSFSYAFLSPLPWRYTGDERPRAGWLRGLAQAVPVCILLFTVLVLIDLAILRMGGAEGVRIRGTSTNLHLKFKEIWLMNLLFGGVPLMTFVGGIITYSEHTEEERIATEAKLREAQGVLLRGQLSPHVLFNSLNALAELVRQDPIRAEEAILDLSELYRSLLLHGDKEKASLGEERQLVHRYLSVEQLRLGDRLRLSWNWDKGVDSLLVPPFLLQPLVENALKHGIAGSSEGGDLRIEAREELHGFRIRVSNTGQSTPLVLGTGIGLKNLEARLQLAYGPHAWFTLKTEQPWTVAEIRVQSPELWRHL